MDNKVFNFISIIGVSDITEMKRRIGPEKVTMNLEVIIESYTVNVDGEDQIDQQNSAGGFASEFLG